MPINCSIQAYIQHRTLAFCTVQNLQYAFTSQQMTLRTKTFWRNLSQISPVLQLYCAD